MHWKRRRYLWRAFQSRKQLTSLTLKNSKRPSGPLLFATLRNEVQRLPYVLDYYRKLGVTHFFFVDNASTDHSAELIKSEPDCSLWQTSHSYKASRFGMDWLNFLLNRHGAGHWCLTVDIDELFAFPGKPQPNLANLTSWLDQRGETAFGALMLDLYPQGPVGDAPYEGGDPIKTLNWFDPGPYRAQRQVLLQNLWVQGGVRERVFFNDTPRKSPTLNKIPLVKWRRGYAYVNSTHSMLPRHMNRAYIDMSGRLRPSGVLAHTKFLNSIVEKSAEEKHRRQHFTNSAGFDAYYNAIIDNPVLWYDGSLKYQGPDQLVRLGLIGGLGETMAEE